MQFRALILDSFRESLDRKIFWVMLLICLAVTAAMACVGFEPGKVSILFGTWVQPTDIFTVGGVLQVDLIASVVVEWIMDTVLGWIGVLLAIVATAGFFPAMMERGAIEVPLSKPIPRWKLFLGKYLGSLSFLLIHATIFVFLTFLVVGLRWGAWLPGYLLAIPLVVLLFSFLYCVSVLVAVVSRSAIAAVLVTLGAWVGFTGVQSVDDAFISFPEWQEYRVAYQSIHVARWIIPKTQDITYIARQWSRAANPTALMPQLDADAREVISRGEKAEAARLAISPVLTLGSSLLFEAAVVLLAMWKFSRTDF